MAAAAVVASVTLERAGLSCDACGSHGIVTAQSAGLFTRSHYQPVVRWAVVNIGGTRHLWRPR